MAIKHYCRIPELLYDLLRLDRACDEEHFAASFEVESWSGLSQSSSRFLRTLQELYPSTISLVVEHAGEMAKK